jgi:hypothetical protein
LDLKSPCRTCYPALEICFEVCTAIEKPGNDSIYEPDDGEHNEDRIAYGEGAADNTEDAAVKQHLLWTMIFTVA